MNRDRSFFDFLFERHEKSNSRIKPENINSDQKNNNIY